MASGDEGEHNTLDPDSLDNESEISKVLIDDTDESCGQGVDRDAEYAPDVGSASDEDYNSGGESDKDDDDDSDVGVPAVRVPKGKRSSRRRRQFSKSGFESDGEEGEEVYDDDDDDGGDDEAVARALDMELNQPTRGRPTRRAARKANKRLMGQLSGDSSEGDGDGSELDLDAFSPRPPRRMTQRSPQSREPFTSGRSTTARTRSSQRVVGRISYKESSSDSDTEDGKNKKKRIIPALEDGNEEQDDEVERILVHRDQEGVVPNKEDPWASREFYVKWKRWAYIHCSWETRNTLAQLRGFKRVLNYIRSNDEREILRKDITREEVELLDVEDAMEAELVEDHKVVDRIVSERRQDDGTLQYLIKWRGLPYSECTWENSEHVFSSGGAEAVDDFKNREQRLFQPSRSVEGQRRSFQSRKQKPLEHQPAYLRVGTLRDYQLQGLNWLVYSWARNYNCILADEMGLGKTVQCVSFLSYLSETLQILGPFLVMVPLSTVPNWIKEFRKWAPQINAVVYVGDSDSREVIRRFETFNNGHNNRSRPYKFEVLITTFDFALKDAHVLGRMDWSYLLVDEAHRLKNADSSLYQEMSKWSFKNKLLVTGTPLQNSLKELWALLHFLNPEKFPDCEAFEENYSMENAHEVSKLHADLRPYLLRRVIKDVEKSLPPKKERILRVEMSPMQRQYYKWVLGKNFTELNKGSSGHVSLLNIISELKKCCNHPFLFESAAEQFQGSDEDQGALERLIVTSGKMVLVDKLLTKLKETGHRVLIFSQMVRMLDILAAYLRYKGYQHQRLDGSTPSHIRHQAMEHFNAPGSEDFAFLLSTRAGGLGINLATADTVIIFDSDWNPQNDLQAMSRAHRIGQKETVNIYRFVTKCTVEEDILERAKKKMVLDHLVIQKMDTSGRTVLEARAQSRTAKKMFAKEELAAILRFGAEDLFKVDEAQGAEQLQKLRAEDINSILERAEEVDTTNQKSGPSELLNQFQVATFKTGEDDAAFWRKLIPEAQRPKPKVEQAAESDSELGPRAARLKAQRKVEQQMSSDESDWQPAKHTPPAPRSNKPSTSKQKNSKSSKPKKAVPKPGPPVPGALLRIDIWPEERAEEASPENSGDPGPSRTLGKRDAHAFVRGARRFGLEHRLPQIVREVGSSVAEASERAQKALLDELLSGCQRVVEQCTEPKDAILDFFGVAVKAQEFLAHFEAMKMLASQVEALSDPVYFRLDNAQMPAPPRWGKSVNWTSRDDAMLLLGVYFHGASNWEQMSKDDRLQLGTKLEAAVNGDGAEIGISVGPRSFQLETRVAALLRRFQGGSTPPKAANSRQGSHKRAGGAGRAQAGQSHVDIAARPVRTGNKRSQPDRSRPDRQDKQKKHKENDKRKLKEDDRQRRHKEASTSGKPSDPHNCAPILEAVVTELRKLRALKSVDLPVEKLLHKTKKYLYMIGQHIERVTQKQSHTRVMHCWEYVSGFAGNNKPGDKLKQMYDVIKQQKPPERPVDKRPPVLGKKRPQEDSQLDRRNDSKARRVSDKPSRDNNKQRRHRYSPDPDDPPMVCRSVKDYMKLFGEDRDRVERLEEVNSESYFRRVRRS